MYLVRDIFYLKFGAFKAAHKLFQEARDKDLMPASEIRLLSDFTGRSYRFIFESQYESLGTYERELSGGMRATEWQEWYTKFVVHVESSEREILKIH